MTHLRPLVRRPRRLRPVDAAPAAAGPGVLLERACAPRLVGDLLLEAPASGHLTDQARSVCQVCPRLRTCRTEATTTLLHVPGVVAGLTLYERARIADTRPA